MDGNALALNDEDFMRAMEANSEQFATSAPESNQTPNIEDTTSQTQVTTNTDTTVVSDDIQPATVVSDEQVDDKQTSQEPKTDEENSEDNTNNSDTSDTAEIDYKAFYETVTQDFKASNKMMPGVKDPQKLIKALQMATDYAQKTAALKPALKRVKMLEGISDEQLMEMLDFNKRNPEVIKKAVKDLQVDPIDIDLENINYVPQSQIMSDSEYEFQELISKISKEPEFVTTQNILMNTWDEASKTKALLDPKILEALHNEVTSGRIHKIEAEVLQLKTFGDTQGLSDLELYASIAARMDKEQEEGNSNKQQAVVIPTTINNEALDDKRTKANISTKKTVAVKNEYNPLKLSDEEFMKLLQDGAEFIK